MLWKAAIVTPVQKSKGNYALTNYRPISVLPAISKIAERVIHTQLLNHLLENDLLSHHQSEPFYMDHSIQLRMYCYM